MDRKFDYSCPNCRQSPGRLRDRAGIEGEKKDWSPDDSEAWVHNDALLDALHLIDQGLLAEELPRHLRIIYERNRLTWKLKVRLRQMKEKGDGLV